MLLLNPPDFLANISSAEFLVYASVPLAIAVIFGIRHIREAWRLTANAQSEDAEREVSFSLLTFRFRTRPKRRARRDSS
jgi:hypothetical protein